MITRLRVENFKCLRDVTLDLGPLTVLIGPNDSGKSSLLDALHLLGKTVESGASAVFQGPTAPDELLWRHEKGLALRWEVDCEAGSKGVRYKFELSGGYDASYVETLLIDGWQHLRLQTSLRGLAESRLVTTPAAGSSVVVQRAVGATVLRALAYNERYSETVEPFLRSLVTPGRYHLSTDALRLPSVPEPGAVLSPRGDNLAAIVDAIFGGPDRDVRAAFEDALHAIIPTLRGVTTPPAAGDKPGAKEVHFVLAGTNGKRPVTIPGALASDGALLVTAFLALAYGPTPDLLLIEEPENGLHPARVGDVMALLRRMSRGEVGDRPRQIIITTHNPLFLNQAQPEEVRIVQRDNETGTRVTPLTQVKDIDAMLKDFGIGELWAMLGEKGLVEGAAP